MIRQILPAAALIALVACSKAGTQEQAAPADSGQVHRASATATTAPAAAAPEPNRAGVARAKATDAYSYGYKWPAEAASIPALDKLMSGWADKALADLASGAEDWQATAAKDDMPFHAYSYEQEWQVVANLPRFLSLSSNWSTYEGGAHGMYGSRALIWDRQTGKQVAAQDFFTSPAALERAIAKPYCDALNAERKKRRGDFQMDLQEFNSCVALADTTVLLGSSNGKTFDRIGLLVDPYVAGPYAEGSFEFTLPVSHAVIDALQPAYRPYFSQGR
ncbi:MAG: DUF3298 and DUF4163 domain-containing protein [Sphingomonadales bacterium]|nr:DUF3298 and DUF4163 domain-containing protein [Sphingomonadales bacterium]MBD3773598.1 DUF3298 and DUF4163 domain-containing protein [Paracoccaceae bacterium]